MSLVNDSLNNNSMNLLLQPSHQENAFEQLNERLKRFESKKNSKIFEKNTFNTYAVGNENNKQNDIFFSYEIKPEKQKTLNFMDEKSKSKHHHHHHHHHHSVLKSKTITEVIKSLDEKINLKQMNNLQNMQNLFKIGQNNIKEENEINENKKKNRLIFDEDSKTSEDIDINDIYNELIMSEKPIQNSLKIPLCSVLKYGTKPSVDEIEYSFCKTCDDNLINPICIECINKCHQNHNYKKEFFKGNIKCFCGKNLHKINDNNKNNIDIIPCTFNEFSIVSKLYVYYINDNLENICVFCHNFCSIKENDKIVNFNCHNNNINYFPKCECKNEQNHCEYKRLLEKINKISFLDYDIFNLLNPIQKLNLIFLSKNSFNDTYKDFIYLIYQSKNFNNKFISTYTIINNNDNFFFFFFI